MRQQPVLPNYPNLQPYRRDRSLPIDEQGRVNVAESDLPSDELSPVYPPNEQE